MKTNVLVMNVVLAILLILSACMYYALYPSDASRVNNQPITIWVKNNQYQPSYIQVKAGKPVMLQFIREDANPCASSVLFPQLNAAYALEMHKRVQITLPPQERGEIDFICQAGDYHGKIIVA